MLSRFASSIQLERQDFNGRMLTIRRSDLRVLACMGRSLEDLGVRLEQLGLRASVKLVVSDRGEPQARLEPESSGWLQLL